MKILSVSVLLFLSFTIVPSAVADLGTSSTSGAQMPQSKIACLLEAAGHPKEMANATAKDLYEAVQRVHPDGSRFTSTAMIHFLAQVEGNSGGYGLLGIAGNSNLKDAEDCINAAQPGAGLGVATNPENTLGIYAKNKVVSAMASVCWWQKNIMNNPENDVYEKDPSALAVTKISHVVNGGMIASDKRVEAFNKMIAKERTSCGAEFITSR